ncbi:membrane integrity-associated transporter subunit PqiC [Nevskia sp.]|uniref:PqiC family protein n=1 Tax=Nevskia sp. TaxID=1929292 RepID=UPI0025E63B6F|nr:PqiC family protein [Nevskia sp.]
MRNPSLAALTALTLLAGCQSAAPIRFYTLLPAATRDAAPAQDPAFRIELGAVTIPSQVDTPKIVIRESAGRLAPVEGQRWIAPLADEVRASLSAALTQKLGVPDIGYASASETKGLPLYRVRVSLRRFESILGSQALIDATWTVSSASDAARSATCDSRVESSIAGGFDALAEGHQRALAVLAGRIAQGLEALNAGKASNVCVAAEAG